MSQCKVLFLSYGYMPTGRIEPYRERLIKVLAGAGCKVLAIKTNSFFQEFSHEPLFANAIAPLVSEIERFQPDVVISINRTGLSPEILAATSGAPIITLFQDPHYYATETLLQFGKRDFLCFIFPNPEFFEQELTSFAVQRGAVPSQLINIPFTLDSLVFFPSGQARDLDVSFVGSSFGTDFANLVAEVVDNATARDTLVRTFLAHRRQFNSDIPGTLRKAGVDFEDDVFYRSLALHEKSTLLRAIKRGSVPIQGIFDDQINAERRIHHLAALTEFKFEMYGLRDDIWIRQMALVNPELLACYQYRAIDEPKDLAAIYNRSKVGFNISRIAAAEKGFSFRVPELIACETLLLTEHFARQPMAKLGFVEDKHFITYDSPETLRRKCAHYLSHEDQRLSIVSAAKAKLDEFGMESTLHGSVAACMRRAGFSELAARIERLTNDDLRYTADVHLYGDFRGCFLAKAPDGNPRVFDLSQNRPATAKPAKGPRPQRSLFRKLLKRAKKRLVGRRKAPAIR